MIPKEYSGSHITLMQLTMKEVNSQILEVDPKITIVNGISVKDPQVTCRSSRPEEFLGKGILKICSKFTGEQPFRIGVLL